MKRDPVVIIVVAMVVTVMLVFGFQMARRNSGGAPVAGPSMKGHRRSRLCPEVSRWQDGSPFRFSRQSCAVELLGHLVPALQNRDALVRRAAKAIRAAGITDCRRRHGRCRSPKEIGEFAHDLGVNYPILVGKEAVGDAYGGVQFLPATFYIGRDGKVVDKVFGLKGRGEIEDNIKKALAEGQAVQAQK